MFGFCSLCFEINNKKLFKEKWIFKELHFGQKSLLKWLIRIIIILKNGSLTLEPDFASPLQNISVPIGRDAVFTCSVKYLGGHRVGWIKADTKAIQAIHEQVITHNPRISADTWNLHIKSVRIDDTGGYMCQINTDPMKSNLGYLNVLEPPDFILDEFSTDIVITEGDDVSLVCRASGRPKPSIVWKRENGDEIILREDGGGKYSATSFQGEVLQLNKVTREAMGTYLCIASNGVPPSIQRKHTLIVLFHPTIHVPNQLVGSPIGTDVMLECIIQASPKAISYWIRDTGEMVVSSQKYLMKEILKSPYETRALLTVHSLNKMDVGSYSCIAKNSIGEVTSSIRLYEIPGFSKSFTTPRTEDITEENKQIWTKNIIDNNFPTLKSTSTVSSNNNDLVITSYISRRPYIVPRVVFSDETKFSKSAYHKTSIICFISFSFINFI
ncbi:lachesin-like isoform X2 [Culicoides brevitarsis]|uniref:lachesin-like isoform X2 n=1 Tax=Culicoides brevitarsis TaxID=469753 RepID=UPI00307C5B14